MSNINVEKFRTNTIEYEEKQWKAFVHIALISEDIIEAYLVYRKAMKFEYRKPLSPRAFRQELALWSKHLGTPLPDGRRRKTQSQKELKEEEVG